MTLVVSAGAELSGTTDRRGYPLDPPLASYGGARDNAHNTSVVHRSLIHCDGCSNVRITGAGTIDGNGGAGGWWAAAKNGTLEFQRPRLVQLVHARNVIIDGGITLRNSAFWTTHLVYASDVVVRGVRIEAPRDSPNTDGVDVSVSRPPHTSHAVWSASRVVAALCCTFDALTFK